MADEKNLFVELEHEVMELWEKEKYYDKLVEKNKGNKMFRFLDGPITANNPMGIHHAWGRSTKDIFIRYKSMQGYDCRRQNGFDSQGLWVEVEVEKQLGFKTKKDIENYGMDKFTCQCVDRVKHFSGIITEQSKRLGQWMDWDNSYYTNTDLNIQGIWHFLKECDNHGWIQREYKPMPWCPRCGTSLSEHEMTGSYKMMTHNSVFFKLPIEELNSKILVWTTTPWTLSSNVALAVNPEIDYVEVKIKSDDQTLILAKNAIKYLGDDKLEVIRALKGEELVGYHYETCFADIPAQQGFEHKIVAWEDVAADEGTGVVHIAPGCGIEDFELGERLGLPKVMPIDDTGIYLDGFGFMSGKDSHTIADEVFEKLDEQNKLYKVEPHEHSYPVCWRCKSEIVFRLVPAWYIKTSEIKPKLITECHFLSIHVIVVISQLLAQRLNFVNMLLTLLRLMLFQNFTDHGLTKLKLNVHIVEKKYLVFQISVTFGLMPVSFHSPHLVTLQTVNLGKRTSLQNGLQKCTSRLDSGSIQCSL